MEPVHSKLHIGLARPMRVLHLSDAHLTPCDGRESAKMQEQSARRKRRFEGSEPGLSPRVLEAMLTYGREHADQIVFTGDLVDAFTEAAVSVLPRWISRDMLYAVGNHELNQIIMVTSDAAHQRNFRRRIQNALARPLDVDIREVGGVTFLTMDNSNYRFSEVQLAQLQTQCARGKPIILCVHIPLYHPEHQEHRQGGDPRRLVHTVGNPEDVLAWFPEDKQREMRPDETTRAFVDLATHHPLVKAILAGHTHENYECVYPDGPVQFISTLVCGGPESPIRYLYGREIEID